jgi:hypothetical protein
MYSGPIVQAEEIVELCENAEKLFMKEKSVLQLKVRWHTVTATGAIMPCTRCLKLKAQLQRS